MFGAMALAVLLALLATALWAGLSREQSLTNLGAIFFLAVGASWAILVPTRFWSQPHEDSLTQRMVMLAAGVAVGALALWVDGWTPQTGLPGREGAGVLAVPARDTPLPVSLSEAASYLCYFAVVFFAVRWWKMTDRRRSQRFSLLPVLATGFWALLLLLLWKNLGHGALALVMASVIVQLVSPWEQPPPPVGRRLRLRYA